MDPRNADLIRHPDKKRREVAHLEVLDNNDLGNGEKDEPAEDDEEIPSPQIIDIQRVPSLDVIRSTDGARSWGSAVKGAGLVRSNNIRVLVHPWAITRNNVCTITH